EVREYILAALDDWATEETDDNRQRIMAITAAATGQGWRTQLSAVWEDPAPLAQVYDTIPEQERTPAIIRAVAIRLNELGEDGIRRMEQGLRQYPADFWLHQTLGNLQSKDRADAAIGAYRAALALRPGASAVLYNLGTSLYYKKDYDAAI